MDEYLDFSGDDFGSYDSGSFDSDSFWADQGDFGAEGLGSPDFNNLEGFDFSSLPDSLSDEEFYGLLYGNNGAAEYPVAPGYDNLQMPTDGPLADLNDTFSSGWQTSGSDRVYRYDDGSGIGYNTETDASYGLTNDQFGEMVRNDQLNNFASGYNTATGGNQVAPGGGTRTVDANGRVSYRMPDGRVINETAGGVLGKPVAPNPAQGGSAKPGASGEKKSGLDMSKLLPLLLLMMAMRDKGGGSANSTIPRLNAGRSQTPYSQQFPAGRRPGSNAINYFNEPQRVQYSAAGGIMGLAAGGAVRRRLTPEEQANDPKNAWARNYNPASGPSDGVLGYLGIKPEQYGQARALMKVGLSSLNNADRLSSVSPEQRARLQAAANAGLTYLNGDALVPGGAGTQNPNTPTFHQPVGGTFGGVQSTPTPAAPTTPTPAPIAAPTPSQLPALDVNDPGAIQASVSQTPYAELVQRPTYRPGQGGIQYFNQVDYTRRAAAGGVMGGIGSLGRYAAGGMGRLVQGPGDGVSDDVPASIDDAQPAKIARGEYVIPARVVAELGNGSTDAGAERLDEMIARIEASMRDHERGGDSEAYNHLPA